MNEMTPWEMVAEAQRRADIKVIRDRMLTLKHLNVLGCPCCETAHDLIKAIEESALTKTAASGDGVVVTVHQ